MRTALSIVFVFGLMIMVHELGHFLAAKKSGVYVEEFGIGYPPRLFGKKIGETLYSINLLPLGGFVKLFGEESDAYEKEKAHHRKKRAFVNQKPWRRIAILTAGVCGNFLLGWGLISILFTRGVPTPTNQIAVEEVQTNSPAQRAGIRDRDLITRAQVNSRDYKFQSSDQLIAFAKRFAGQPVIFQLNRNGKPFVVVVTPRASPPPGQGPLGIVISNYLEKKYPWYQAPFYGLLEAYRITKTIIVELVKTVYLAVTLQKPHVEVAGPIGIAQFTGKAIRYGFNAVLEFVAILSLNLAVINILPFPALDGGRLVFVVYEWVRKKPLNKNVEKYLNLAGFSLLILLVLIISVHDVINLIK